MNRREAEETVQGKAAARAMRALERELAAAREYLAGYRWIRNDPKETATPADERPAHVLRARACGRRRATIVADGDSFWNQDAAEYLKTAGQALTTGHHVAADWWPLGQVMSWDDMGRKQKRGRLLVPALRMRMTLLDGTEPKPRAGADNYAVCARLDDEGRGGSPALYEAGNDNEPLGLEIERAETKHEDLDELLEFIALAGAEARYACA